MALGPPAYASRRTWPKPIWTWKAIGTMPPDVPLMGLRSPFPALVS